MPIELRGRATWAIVLAGGDGSRLAGLTAVLYGTPVPKQFAVFDGRRSLLEATLDRIAPLVAPARTVVVVCRAHSRWVRTQLREHRGFVLVQPSNRGTATAILYALGWIRRREPDAHVLVFPSDHHVEHPDRFAAAVRAAEVASRELGRLTVLGVAPEHADPDYGWIVAGRQVRAGCHAITRFVEKPPPSTAHQLYVDGGLLNTFVLSAPAATIAALAHRHLPTHARAFETIDATSLSTAPDLDQMQQDLPSADFSRHVLQPARGLLVVVAEGTGWSDWGTPDRVLASLRGTPAGRRLRMRLSPASEARLPDPESSAEWPDASRCDHDERTESSATGAAPVGVALGRVAARRLPHERRGCSTGSGRRP